MGEELPEWAARELLADAVKSCGLPWVPWAWWRRPADRWMTPADRIDAIALEGLVVAEARRRLPPGVSGRVIGQTWKDAAWRCIVAGLALLDVDARCRLTRRDEHEHELLVVRAEPAVVAEPAPPQPEAAPVTFTIRRRGEVNRAS